jgi:hypothetical protein
MALSILVRAESPGKRGRRVLRTEIEINLTEPTLPQVHHSNIEEDHHGQQEKAEDQEEDQVTVLRAPRIGAAQSV